MTPGLYILEHKSSSEDVGLGTVYWRRLTIDVQIDTYIEGARSLGYPVIGCLYDVLRKPQLQPNAVPLVDESGVKIVLDAAGQRVRTKDGKKWRQTGDTDAGYVLQTRPESPEEFLARTVAAIGESPDRYYQRGVVSRLEHETREAAIDRWQTASAMRDARRLNVFPRNADSCVQWSRACDYLAVCCGEASIDDPMLFQTEASAHSELGSAACENCGHPWVEHQPGRGCRLLGGAECPCQASPPAVADLPILTQSSMRTFRSCPRKYKYRYEMGRRPLAMKAKPLRVGTGTHSGLEVWWKTGGDLDAAIAASAVDGEPFESARIAAMLTGYHARWIDDQPRMRVVAVEKEFRSELVNAETGGTSKTWQLAGKIDCIVEVT